ncbi:MAG: hypothetical protein GX594_11755 [Pirellulaceae bacterium]|nr:hypothetical protein [Pirellulaceae bacterium]
MLHDPSHYEPPPIAEEIKLKPHDVDVVRTDARSDIVSRHFNIQIRDFADLEKIKMPAVTHNRAATEFRYEAMCRVYEGIMPVRKLGQTHIWFTPWDYLIRWWGIQEAMIDLLRRIPNLRKISVSPWCDAGRAIDRIGGDYVVSRKPSPAVLAEDRWNPDRARRDIRDFLEKARGRCHVELIMKDISTVRYEPQRLWQWAAIASEEAERFAG